MTGFDIHCIKARFPGKHGCLTELLFQGFKVIIRYNAAVICGTQLLIFRMPVSDQRSRAALRVGIAAAVVCLHHQVRRKAIFLLPRFLDLLRKPLIMIQIIPGQHQLMGTGTSLRHNGDGIKPNKTASSH